MKGAAALDLNIKQLHNMKGGRLEDLQEAEIEEQKCRRCRKGKTQAIGGNSKL